MKNKKGATAAEIIA